MAVTASEAGKNLIPLIQQFNDDRVPSADEREAWHEAADLFRSPANARRLLDAGRLTARWSPPWAVRRCSLDCQLNQ